MNTPGDFTAGDTRINRKGRPKAGKSIAEYARLKTKNGRALVDFYCKVFADPEEETENRLKAAQRLEERAFGKAPQQVDVTTGDRPFELPVILQPQITNGNANQNGSGGFGFHFGNGHGAE